MSYISPNSDIIILKGVPLDKDYNHTLYFSLVYPVTLEQRLANQYSTFYAFRKYTFDDQTYQRAGKGKLRIARKADDLYDCNYLMFRNTSYGNKWFYAFLDSPEYINDNCTEVSYTIDVMQTWYFDYKLESCFVEREHTLTDDYGDNLVPENLDVGELIPAQRYSFTYPITSGKPLYKLVVFYVPNNELGYVSGVTYDWRLNPTYTITPCGQVSGSEISPPIYFYYDTSEICNGIYMGCKYYGVDMVVDTESHIQHTKICIDMLINTILGERVGGSIINIVQIPYDIWEEWVINRNPSVKTKKIIEGEIFPNADGTDSTFRPKNAKLFSYPYRCLVVSNNAGQSATYRWEYFSDRSAGKIRSNFEIQGVPVISPEIMCYPTHYRGLLDDYESGLVLTDFPTPPWSEDTFTKWWTQNKDGYVTGLITSAILAIGSIAATAATGGASAAAEGAVAGLSTVAKVGIAKIGTSAVSNVANSLGNLGNVQNTPDQLCGQLSVSSLRTIQNRIGFYFYDMCIERDKAKSIDDYFTMFGYAIKQVKVPNVRSTGSYTPEHLRPHWNYIKTNGCIIHPASGTGLPADDEDLITKIYDKGITFWMSASEVGDYTLTNSPV